jgi:DNA-binding response OmpR family regulator
MMILTCSRYPFILQDFGSIVGAQSGEEALRELLRQDFDLIILDVKLPTMNGFELAALIRQRERFRRTPIIFLTALSSHKEDWQKARSLGAAEVMRKPFSPDFLRAKVLDVLLGGSVGAESDSAS